MKYDEEVYQALEELFDANNYGTITRAQIDKLPRASVLSFYLEWEGIIGYTDTILTILGK